MKKQLFYIIVLFFVLTACQNGDDSNFQDNTYEVEYVKFFLAEGDGLIDSVQYKLDKSVYRNPTSATEYITFSPYEAVKDSFEFIFENLNEFKQVNIESKLIGVPTHIFDGNVYFASSNDIMFPLSGKQNCDLQSNTTTTISIPPNTTCEYTAEYCRKRIKVSFEAHIIGKKKTDYFNIRGYYYCSTPNNLIENLEFVNN